MVGRFGLMAERRQLGDEAAVVVVVAVEHVAVAEVAELGLLVGRAVLRFRGTGEGGKLGIVVVEQIEVRSLVVLLAGLMVEVMG